MRDFEATLKGYKTKKTSFYTVNPDDYDIPADQHEAFKLGIKLGSGRFMIISCDSWNEFQRDVAGFNAAVDEVNAYYGQQIIEHYEIGKPKTETEFSIVDPESGDRHWPYSTHNN
jgi:hypothetical protein